MNTKKKQPSYSDEFRDRAVRLVEEQQKAGLSQWAARQSISQKLGCTPETLRRWVRRVERDEGKRPGLTTEAEYASCKWVDWYNNRRLLESIGDIPPAELEQAYYKQQEGRAEAA